METQQLKNTSNVETAEQFLKFADKFKLGCLLTQQQNPKTINLSTMAQQQLPKAIQAIKQLDIDTIKILIQKLPQLQNLSNDIKDTLDKNGNIYICGCGATGRLALVLQTLWRQQIQQIFTKYNPTDKNIKDLENRVIAFMAGGDAALIKSIQDFQDHPEFAQQQLIQLGFKENDLLIGSTQGGQTPWVIGAVWKASEISHRKPYILYGNTDEILINNVQRSKQFILSNKIIKINCNVGPMALAGSTRMQSTTILMHAIGLALLGYDWIRKYKSKYQSWAQYAKNNVYKFLQYIQQTDFTIIAPLIQYQSNLYQNSKQITYHTDPYYAISILTDTTQRSPTFSLSPFPSSFDPDPQLSKKKCWCNLKILNKEENQQLTAEMKAKRDWSAMLGNRQIRGLNSQYWNKYKHKVSNPIIFGFGLHQSHQERIEISYPLTFRIPTANPQILLSFPNFSQQPYRLSQHSIIKIILNNLSTLIMGRLKRYQSNIMTYVRPTNYKLIDRSARYVRTLLLKQGIQYSYEDIVKVIYSIKNTIKEDQPIVLKVIEVIKMNK